MDVAHLASTSNIIDKVQDVGLPLSGSFPDLGAKQCTSIAWNGGHA
jgi:hypothetical protein